MEYSLFDAFIDPVFIINDEKLIVYCNEAAASLCGQSIKRMVNKRPIFQYVQFNNYSDFIAADGGLDGQKEALPYKEVDVFFPGSGKTGKVQVMSQPVPGDQDAWMIIARDVTLEEVLHSKYKDELNKKEEVIAELEVAQAELEKYSKNLEQMVAQRTHELSQANIMLNAIMESLGQGFLVFDREGKCGSIYTKACQTILETIPCERWIWDVLKVQGGELEQFKMWLNATFSESLPFESMCELAPSQFPHSLGRYIELEYFPLRDTKDQIDAIVLVATDKTVEHEARQALEKEKHFAKFVLQLTRNKSQLIQFLKELPKVTQEIEAFLKNDDFDVEALFRFLHTVEGEAASFSLMTVRHRVRRMQEVLEPLRWGEDSARKSIQGELRKETEVFSCELEGFLQDHSELLGELLNEEGALIDVKLSTVYDFLNFLEKEGVSQLLSEEFKKQFIKVSLKDQLSKFNNVVQAVASKQDKKVAPILFEGEIESIRIDPYLWKPWLSSLVHIFRNAVDHGIEAQEERIAQNKSLEATLTIKTELQQDSGREFLLLTFQDDGRGINIQRIREKAQRIISPAVNQWEDTKVAQLIFHPGLSSRDEVSDFSGRGVGMDAVKTEVEKLGGQVWVESQVGVGTRIYMKIPMDHASVFPTVLKRAS